MCACAEPVGAGIGAGCVGSSGRKWPNTLSNNAHTVAETVNKITLGARTTRYEDAFVSRFALACFSINPVNLPGATKAENTWAFPNLLGRAVCRASIVLVLACERAIQLLAV